jgi:hypothetical protein
VAAALMPEIQQAIVEQVSQCRELTRAGWSRPSSWAVTEGWLDERVTS